MEIQEIGPSYEDKRCAYKSSKPSTLPSQPSSPGPEIPPRKALHNLQKIKKYSSRLRLLEPYTVVPYGMKKLSVTSINQLSNKKVLEAEILLDDIENPYLLNALAKSLKTLTSAKKITLKLTCYGKLNLGAAKWVIWALARLKNIKNLSIHLPYHPDFKEKDFLSLFSPFAGDRNLTSFGLVVYVRFGMKAEVLGRLHDTLSRIKTLENLSLNFALNEYLYRVKPTQFERGLNQRLRHLNKEKLAFSFDVPYSLSRDELVSALKYASSFTSLRSLSINFSSFVHRIDGRIDEEMVSYLLPILLNHPNLAYIDFSFEMSWFLEETPIKDLMKAISQLKSLIGLKLNFASCIGASDKCIYFTATSLSQVPTLEYLSLNYSSCYQLSDQSIQYLIADLSKMKLKKLELNFSNCYKLTPEISKYFVLFTELEALLLNFENCYLMNESTLQYLAKALIKLNNLDTVSLNLNFLKATNYEVCVLGSALSSLRKIKYLSIGLAGNKNITETAFVNLFRNLGVLKELHGLALNLRNNTQISDRALSVFSTIVSSLQSLEELKIDLIGAEMLTEICYPKLVRVFAKFEDSKKVEIMI